MIVMENVSQWTTNPSLDDMEVQQLISYLTGKIGNQDRELEELKLSLAVQRENSHQLGRKLHSLYMIIDKISAERDKLRKDMEAMLAAWCQLK